MSYKYYICLGSNQGNKLGFLKSAKYLLEKEGLDIEKESSYYETEPVGMKEDTEQFINQVISGTTNFDPESFLVMTKEIEKKIGRKNKGNYSDRVIDIDILLCNDLIINNEDLTIPHRELDKRRFVLEPLCEIAPELIHPETGKSISNILERLKDDFSVDKI